MPEQNKKRCPKCGNLCNVGAKFCTSCGTAFQQMQGNTDTTKQDITYTAYQSLMWIAGIIIAIGGFYVIFEAVFKENNIDLTTIAPKKAPNCEAQEVKDLAMQIFKENDYYYKLFAPSTISDVSLIYPAASSYDSEIDKYSCTGTIVVKAANNGFKPAKDDNAFASLIHNYKWVDSAGTYADVYTKYTKYTCRVQYTSQLSEDQTLVTSSYCGSGTLFDSNTNGEFSCEGECTEHVVTPNMPKEEPQKESYKNTSTTNYNHNSGSNSAPKHNTNNNYNTPKSGKYTNSFLNELPDTIFEPTQTPKQNYYKEQQQEKVKDAENELF